MRANMKFKIIGISIIVIAVIIGFVLSSSNKTTPTNSTVSADTPKKVITVKGYIGGEKVGLFDDEEIKGILKKKYGIVVDYNKAGSIEMVKQDNKGMDFLFPSSQVALDMYKSKNGNASNTIILNTPIVLYSWEPITKALIKQGIVKAVNNKYYITDLHKLIDYVIEGKKWSDIGLPNMYGDITIYTTNPSVSNSGNMFAGLLANVIQGNVVNKSTVNDVLPKTKSFFAKIGYMSDSSGDLFQQYLSTGMGSKPIIAGYESQMVEFAIENKDVWNNLKTSVNILYPEPTAWSSHPFISLSDNGKQLMVALQDKDIQRLSWEKHGFRTGLSGFRNDMKVIDFAGIPENIDKIMPMPDYKTMEVITDSLK